MKKTVLFGLILLLIFSCSLSARQEQTLNKNLVLYLKSIEEQNPLVQVSFTHPEFVKYINSRGDEYFKQIFSSNTEEEYLQILDPVMKRVVESDDQIHVLFELKKEYIYRGENKSKPFFVVAISENDGENWFFVKYSMYKNKNICKKIKRILN